MPPQAVQEQHPLPDEQPSDLVRTALCVEPRDGRLYLFHGGKTTVIRAGAKMEVIGSCQIEDYDDVSPAVAGRTKTTCRTLAATAS